MSNNYQKKKHCCTVCDTQKRCRVCGDHTFYACSNCQINLGATIYVCQRSECRNEHEKKCSGDDSMLLALQQERDDLKRQNAELAALADVLSRAIYAAHVPHPKMTAARALAAHDAELMKPLLDALDEIAHCYSSESSSAGRTARKALAKLGATEKQPLAPSCGTCGGSGLVQGHPTTYLTDSEEEVEDARLVCGAGFREQKP